MKIPSIINVLLVDDHELVRSGIALLLNEVEGICVVGVASSGEQALQLTKQLNPDVVLMDVYMPGMSGKEACQRILKTQPHIKIIALSAYNDGVTPNQLLQLGAMGFVSKNTPIAEIAEAIRKVMTGMPYLCREISENFPYQSNANLKNSPFALLSKREAQVADCILDGYDIQEIVQMLTVTDKTVNTYRYRLYRKLNVKNDVELSWLAAKFNYRDRGLMLNEMSLKQS
jgi:two-component system, NarL family, invasion response regulator UvrY